MRDTRLIPVIDGEVGWPPTEPLHAVDALCERCNIRLRAIPDTAVLFRSRWFHPGCADLTRRGL